jgi:RNA polymerase sigma factor (sigma-70 family)
VIQTRHAYRTEFMLKSTPRVHQPAAESECAQSLQALFDAEESPLLRYAFSLTGRRAVAEEIVQDVFLQLHKHWADVQSPKAWLIQSVRNKAFSYLRDNKREVLDGDAQQPSLTYTADQSPEETLLQMEAMGALRQLVEELDETDQQLVKLKYFDDLKYRDISEQTGLSVGNVGYRLHHILKQLAGKLRQLGIDGKS